MALSAAVMYLVVCVCDLREADVWQRCILHHEPTFCLLFICEELSNMLHPLELRVKMCFNCINTNSD